MRGWVKWLMALLLAGAAGCRPGKEPSPDSGTARAEPTPVIRWRFNGVQSPQGDTVRQAWVLLSEHPEASRLRTQTREKLTTAPFRAWPARAATATNDFAGAFHEMLRDLAAGESLFEATGDSNRFTELVLAVRLAPDRAEFWRSNLLMAFSAWSGQRPVASATTPDWQLPLTDPGGRVRWVRAGAWTLLGWAAETPARLEQLRARLTRGESLAGPDTNAWLEVFADLSRLPAGLRARWWRAVEGWLPDAEIAPERLPTVRLALLPRGQLMRLEGELTWSQRLAVRLEPWQIPSDLICDPIIGFTAARGIEGLMQKWFAALGLPAEAAPNQLLVWTGGAFPVQVLAAAPTPDAEKVLQSAAAVLPARFNASLSAADAGALELLTNAANEVALRWTDIPPFITPFLTVSTGSNQTHLVAGLYPNWAVPGASSPTALFEHLTRATNLMFYDWEFTGPRAYSWRASVNVIRNVLRKPRLDAATAAVAFLNSLTNHPGNTVTELRVADSNRLTLVRESPFVFTGAELVWLAHWLESPEFPFRLRFAEAQPEPAP